MPYVTFNDVSSGKGERFNVGYYGKTIVANVTPADAPRVVANALLAQGCDPAERFYGNHDCTKDPDGQCGLRIKDAVSIREWVNPKSRG